MDPAQIEHNITLEQAIRRANLLAAAAQVSQNITQILDIDELLPQTVDIICDTYGFYYAGIFLIDEGGEFAHLRAGRGVPGRIMIENRHKLAVGGKSMVGACTARNEARISLHVDTETVWYPNPVLPDTRSEIALPLAVGGKVIGAVTVQSIEAAAFSDEDITSLQAMANQLAIAIDNARQRRALEQAHTELVKAKTFEAIATATGDAIHWIGNKAEPINGALERIRLDVQTLVYIAADLFNAAPPDISQHPLAQLFQQEAQAIPINYPEISRISAELTQLPPRKLAQHLSLASMLEDVDIIRTATTLIMKVKEELIGPAREQAPRPTMVSDVLQDAVTSLALPPQLIRLHNPANLPLVLSDPVQLHRVFVNLLKNAREALGRRPDARITLTLSVDADNNFLQVDISDNGPGIPADEIDKIWVTFHTTKNVHAHAGLGLPACRLILEQIGGNISMTSQPGQGAAFTAALPIYHPQKIDTAIEPGRGKILLVDDNDSWSNFAKNTLTEAGFKVKVIAPGQLKRQAHQHHLILIDEYLINATLPEILQNIKTTGTITHTVVVSSNPRVESTKTWKLIGIKDVLPKPYTPARLVREINKIMHVIR
jgi:signal transduction histidine kinase/CheY-like chemotaxis protein